MTVQELIDHLRARINDGSITPETEVWEERTGEHRRLNKSDICASSGNYIYDADEGDCLEDETAVIFGAWD